MLAAVAAVPVPPDGTGTAEQPWIESGWCTSGSGLQLVGSVALARPKQALAPRLLCAPASGWWLMTFALTSM